MGPVQPHTSSTVTRQDVLDAAARWSKDSQEVRARLTLAEAGSSDPTTALLAALEAEGGALTLSARALRIRMLAGVAPAPGALGTAFGGVDLGSPGRKAAMQRAADELSDRLGANALVSLVVDNTLVFMGVSSGWGPLPEGAPLEWSGCLEVVGAGAPWRTRDIRTVPSLTGTPSARSGTRAYAGVPLRLPSGEVVGTCCVMSSEVRDWDSSELSALAAVAAALGVELGEGA